MGIKDRFAGSDDDEKVKLRWSDDIPQKQCKEIPHGRAGEIKTENGGTKEVCILAFDNENDPVEFDWDELGGESIKIKQE